MGEVPVVVAWGGWIWPLTLVATLAAAAWSDRRRSLILRTLEPQRIPGRTPPGLRGALIGLLGFTALFVGAGELGWRSLRGLARSEARPASLMPVAGKLAAISPFRRAAALDALGDLHARHARDPGEVRTAARLYRLAGKCTAAVFTLGEGGLVREGAEAGVACGDRVSLHAAGALWLELGEPERAAAALGRIAVTDHERDDGIRDTLLVALLLAGDLPGFEAAAAAAAKARPAESYTCLEAWARARRGDGPARAVLDGELTGDHAMTCGLLLADVTPGGARAEVLDRLAPKLEAWAPAREVAWALRQEIAPAEPLGHPDARSPEPLDLLTPAPPGWRDLALTRAFTAVLAARPVERPAVQLDTAATLGVALTAAHLGDFATARRFAQAAGSPAHIAATFVGEGRWAEADAALAVLPADAHEGLRAVLAAARTRTRAPLTPWLLAELEGAEHLEDAEKRDWRIAVERGDPRPALEQLENHLDVEVLGGWLLWLAPTLQDSAPIITWLARRDFRDDYASPLDHVSEAAWVASFARALGKPEIATEDAATLGRWRTLWTQRQDVAVPLFALQPL